MDLSEALARLDTQGYATLGGVLADEGDDLSTVDLQPEPAQGAKTMSKPWV